MERTVTISLEEYEDMQAKLNAKSSGYYEIGKEWTRCGSKNKYNYYEKIPDPWETDWGKGMENKIRYMSKPETVYLDKERIVYKDNPEIKDKLNKIPKWIRKIFGAE